MSEVTALFVDDDIESSQALIRSLARHSDHISCHHAKNSEEAQRFIASRHPEVAVIDLSLDPAVGPSSGLALIDIVLQLDPNLRVLVLTGHDSKEWGIKAIQQGAASFIEKPASAAHLIALIEDAAKYTVLRREHEDLSKQQIVKSIPSLETASPEMQKVVDSIAFIASTSQPVMLLGETGVGKGVIAHAIHKLSSRKGAFARFQPSYASHDLVASELFGHEKGSFTGATDKRQGLIEEADGGTLFMDEVDSLPKETQVAMLHVLQERSYRKIGGSKDLKSDFRLITATNYDSDKLVSNEKLREDFYHRIAHQKIYIPALRERKEDIPILTENFIRNISDRENIPVRGIAPRALKELNSHTWPGNVRELLACVENATFKANFNERKYIEAEDIHFESPIKHNENGSHISFRNRVHQFELEIIQETLDRNGNNQSQAAKELDIDRTTLRRILNRK